MEEEEGDSPMGIQVRVVDSRASVIIVDRLFAGSIFEAAGTYERRRAKLHRTDAQQQRALRGHV